MVLHGDANQAPMRVEVWRKPFGASGDWKAPSHAKQCSNFCVNVVYIGENIASIASGLLCAFGVWKAKSGNSRACTSCMNVLFITVIKGNLVRKLASCRQMCVLSPCNHVNHRSSNSSWQGETAHHNNILGVCTFRVWNNRSVRITVFLYRYGGSRSCHLREGLCFSGFRAPIWERCHKSKRIYETLTRVRPAVEHV